MAGAVVAGVLWGLLTVSTFLMSSPGPDAGVVAVTTLVAVVVGTVAGAGVGAVSWWTWRRSSSRVAGAVVGAVATLVISAVVSSAFSWTSSLSRLAAVGLLTAVAACAAWAWLPFPRHCAPAGDASDRLKA